MVQQLLIFGMEVTVKRLAFFCILSLFALFMAQTQAGAQLSPAPAATAELQQLIATPGSATSTITPAIYTKKATSEEGSIEAAQLTTARKSIVASATSPSAAISAPTIRTAYKFSTALEVRPMICEDSSVFRLSMTALAANCEKHTPAAGHIISPIVAASC